MMAPRATIAQIWHKSMTVVNLLVRCNLAAVTSSSVIEADVSDSPSDNLSTPSEIDAGY